MKDLYIHFFKNIDYKDIDEILINKLHAKKFLFNKEKTELYRENLPGVKVFVLEMINNIYYTLLFFHASNKNVYKLVKIKIDNISDNEFDNMYNGILDMFINEIKRNKYFKTVIVDDTIDINKIITSKICREQLLNLLESFPNSYHPFDINRMDQIIWSIHKYSRNKIDIDTLKEYLYKDEKLDKNYIDFLTTRIKNGLQLLYINSTKYRY
jgi:hypothetical protein